MRKILAGMIVIGIWMFLNTITGAQGPNNPPGSLYLNSPAPIGIQANQIGGRVIGIPGQKQYYYWVVVNYGIGQSVPGGPKSIPNANFTLDTNNYVSLTWTAVSGASTYDLLRSTNRNVPTGACNCAVATGLTVTNATDQTNSLSSYTVSSVTNATGVISLDNISSGGPIAQISLNGGAAVPLLYSSTPLSAFARLASSNTFTGTLNTFNGKILIQNTDIDTFKVLENEGEEELVVDGINNFTYAPRFVAKTFAGNDGLISTHAADVCLTRSASGAIWLMDNCSLADFGRLQFGGTTSSFPSIKRTLTKMVARLADDSNPATFEGKFNSSDSSAGVTSATCSSWKDGLCVAP